MGHFCQNRGLRPPFFTPKSGPPDPQKPLKIPLKWPQNQPFWARFRAIFDPFLDPVFRVIFTPILTPKNTPKIGSFLGPFFHPFLTPILTPKNTPFLTPFWVSIFRVSFPTPSCSKRPQNGWFLTHLGAKIDENRAFLNWKISKMGTWLASLVPPLGTPKSPFFGPGTGFWNPFRHPSRGPSIGVLDSSRHPSRRPSAEVPTSSKRAPRGAEIEVIFQGAQFSKILSFCSKWPFFEHFWPQKRPFLTIFEDFWKFASFAGPPKSTPILGPSEGGPFKRVRAPGGPFWNPHFWEVQKNWPLPYRVGAKISQRTLFSENGVLKLTRFWPLPRVW